MRTLRCNKEHANKISMQTMHSAQDYSLAETWSINISLKVKTVKPILWGSTQSGSTNSVFAWLKSGNDFREPNRCGPWPGGRHTGWRCYFQLCSCMGWWWELRLRIRIKANLNHHLISCVLLRYPYLHLFIYIVGDMIPFMRIVAKCEGQYKYRAQHKFWSKTSA